jgi:hypothetical protein
MDRLVRPRRRLRSGLSDALAKLGRHRYLALSALVLALMAGQTANGNWVGDFWEHAAAVRELAGEPLHPDHPLLAVDEAHVGFAPYQLALGLFSKLTGVSAVATLELAGLVNLILLLVGLRLFVGVFTWRPTAPFYTLAALLLLYGWTPWEASGLFNLNSLGYVLSYPSTFATALSFFAIHLFARWLREKQSLLCLIAVAVIAAIATLTHPLSAVLVFPTLAVLVIDSRRFDSKVLVPCTAMVALSGGLVLAWPHFSMLELFTDNVGLYDETNRFIYEGVGTRAVTLLLAVPLVWQRLRLDRGDPLSLLALFFALLYAYGAISENWNWGRVIAFEFIVAFTLLGDFAARLESRLLEGRLDRRLALAVPVLAALLVAVELVNMRSGISHAKPGAEFEDDRGTSRFPAYEAFLTGADPDSVTLAGLRAGRGIPVYSGKVVANNNPEAFVEDHPRRQRDVRRFFDPSTTQTERREVIDRYGVSYVFLDREQSAETGAPLSELLELGQLERSEDGLTLIRVAGG